MQLVEPSKVKRCCISKPLCEMPAVNSLTVGNTGCS